jgi:hypothetical protein
MGLVLYTVGTVVLATPLRVERQIGAESCTNAEDLRRAVNRAVETEALVLDATGDTTSGIAVVFRKEAAESVGVWRFTATVTSPQGKRDLTDVAKSCEALSNAVAVSLSLMVRQITLSALTGPPSSSFRFTLAAGFTAMVPLTSLFTPGAEAGLDGGFGKWWFGLRASYFLRRAQLVAPGLVELDAGTISLFGGVMVLETSTIRMGPVVGVRAGALLASGSGFPANRSVLQPWGTAQAGGEVRLRIVGQLGFSVRLLAEFHLVRPAFDVIGVGSVYQAPVASGSVATGLFYTF